MKHFSDQPLQKLHTFQIKGVVNDLYLIETLDDAKTFRAEHSDFIILGKGSNSILSQSAASKDIVQVSSSYCDPTYKDGQIHLSAGMAVSQLLRLSQDMGLTGFEFSAGVPATLGGMIAMNFGCWGKEMADMVESVDVLTEDNELLRLSKDDCQFSYRHSLFQEKNWIILSATCIVKEASSVTIKETIHRYVQDRLAKQPIRGKTFGSVFRNPDGDSAARLIEATGLKGYEKDGVIVSPKHANFFENTGSASSESVLSMIQLVQTEVKQQYHVDLSPEVKLFI